MKFLWISLINYELSATKAMRVAYLTSPTRRLLQLNCYTILPTPNWRIFTDTKKASRSSTIPQQMMIVAYLTRPTRRLLQLNHIHNFTNSKPEDPHGYKVELKVRYNATTAIARKLPNRTGFLVKLLTKETVPLDWNNYCRMIPT